MNRRNFVKWLFGALAFPTIAYSALKPELTALAEGVTPAFKVIERAPKVMAVVDDWPLWQYGDFITADHPLADYDIKEYKSLCRMQARETFETLQVPDACDKMEFVVHQAEPNSGDLSRRQSIVGWRVTIPAPQWQLVLSEHGDKRGMLKAVLRTRKRLIPISLNGNIQMIPRAYVRDYLRLVAR